MTILPSPPPEWRRLSIPLALQVALLKALLRRMGVDKVHYDHRPPLSERQFDPCAWDTVPSANDPAYIEAIPIEEHARRTHGTRATSLGSDAHSRAKVRRITKQQEDFRRRLLAKDVGEPRPPSRWPKKSFRRER